MILTLETVVSVPRLLAGITYSASKTTKELFCRIQLASPGTINPEISPQVRLIFQWRLIRGEGLFKGWAYSRGGLIQGVGLF